MQKKSIYNQKLDLKFSWLLFCVHFSQMSFIKCFSGALSLFVQLWCLIFNRKRQINHAPKSLKNMCKKVFFIVYFAIYHFCCKTGILRTLLIFFKNFIKALSNFLQLLSPNAGKCGPENTPYLNTFCAVTDVMTIQ